MPLALRMKLRYLSRTRKIRTEQSRPVPRLMHTSETWLHGSPSTLTPTPASVSDATTCQVLIPSHLSGGHSQWRNREPAPGDSRRFPCPGQVRRTYNNQEKHVAPSHGDQPCNSTAFT